MFAIKQLPVCQEMWRGKRSHNGGDIEPSVSSIIGQTQRTLKTDAGVAVCKLALLPCCSPHGSFLSLQSSFLGWGHVLVEGDRQLGALHTKPLLVPALCLGRADGSRRLPLIRWDQTDEPKEEIQWQRRQHTGLHLKDVMLCVVITPSWSWASDPAWSCPPLNSSESLPYRQQRRVYTHEKNS